MCSCFFFRDSIFLSSQAILLTTSSVLFNFVFLNWNDKVSNDPEQFYNAHALINNIFQWRNVNVNYSKQQQVEVTKTRDWLTKQVQKWIVSVNMIYSQKSFQTTQYLTHLHRNLLKSLTVKARVLACIPLTHEKNVFVY